MIPSLVFNTNETLMVWFLNLFQKHYYMIFENYYTKFDGRSAKIVKITIYVTLDNAPLFLSGVRPNQGRTVNELTWFSTACRSPQINYFDTNSSQILS